MRRSRLVQRLKRTTLIQHLEKPETLYTPNPFTFGGGFLNGGVSDEGMRYLSEIFSFAQMLRAEYEFGAVPQALNLMSTYAGEEGLTKAVCSFPVAYIPTDKLHHPQDYKPRTESTVQLWAVCVTSQKDEVVDRLEHIVLRKKHPGVDLLDDFYIWRVLKFIAPQWDIIGGLELDNGFLVTTEENIADKFMALFNQLHKD